MSDQFKRLLRWRWASGEPTCPHCGAQDPYFISTRREFNCSNPGCRARFSPTSGTPFRNNKLGAERLVDAIDAINAHPEASTLELSRLLGMSYKGADYLAKRVRAAKVVIPPYRASAAGHG